MTHNTNNITFINFFLNAVSRKSARHPTYSILLIRAMIKFHKKPVKCLSTVMTRFRSYFSYPFLIKLSSFLSIFRYLRDLFKLMASIPCSIIRSFTNFAKSLVCSFLFITHWKFRNRFFFFTNTTPHFSLFIFNSHTYQSQSKV